MRLGNICVTVMVALALSPLLDAQTLKSETTDGGSVVTDLGYNIQVNKGSTLHRSFVNINDPAAPVRLIAAGVQAKYGRDRYSFAPVGDFSASEPITALEVRFVLYDVFGGRMKTLSATEVTDFSPNMQLALSQLGSWYAWENEVSELLTVVAFVANARLASGKLWRFNEKAVSEELAKLNLKVTSGALEPTKEERKQ